VSYPPDSLPEPRPGLPPGPGVANVAIAHLGPPGTYSEAAAVAFADGLGGGILCPYPSIPQTLEAVASGAAQWAVVPVENALQGSVASTLDTLWRLEGVFVNQAIVLPIAHVLLSYGTDLAAVRAVYSHPQALAQCQRWLNAHLPQVQLVPTNSTTEALDRLKDDRAIAAIASQRAAALYDVPVRATHIGDRPDNATRFWCLSRTPNSGEGTHTSLAFLLPQNAPGALLEPLAILAEQRINLCRIESRPTQRSFGDYLFFIDCEGGQGDDRVAQALERLATKVETLRVFGSYCMVPVP
jgi:prephenate dehydratase